MSASSRFARAQIGRREAAQQPAVDQHEPGEVAVAGATAEVPGRVRHGGGGARPNARPGRPCARRRAPGGSRCAGPRAEASGPSRRRTSRPRPPPARTGSRGSSPARAAGPRRRRPRCPRRPARAGRRSTPASCGTRLTMSRATGTMPPAPPFVPGTSTSTFRAASGPSCFTKTRSYFAGPGPARHLHRHVSVQLDRRLHGDARGGGRRRASVSTMDSTRASRAIRTTLQSPVLVQSSGCPNRSRASTASSSACGRSTRGSVLTTGSAGSTASISR